MQKLVALPAGETAMAGNDTISNGMLLLLTRWKANQDKTEKQRIDRANEASTGRGMMPRVKSETTSGSQQQSDKSCTEKDETESAKHGETNCRKFHTWKGWSRETQERVTNARVRSHAKKHGGRTMQEAARSGLVLVTRQRWACKGWVT